MDIFFKENDYYVGVCNNSGQRYLFSSCDYDVISSHHWWSQSTGVFTAIDTKTKTLCSVIIDEKFKKVLKRNGDTFDFRRENLFYKNPMFKSNGVIEVECFNGQKFIVSEESENIIKEHIWHIDKNNYVITKLESRRAIKLHRLILNVVDDPDVEVDHINRNTRDNRIENLRIATRSINCYNRDLKKYNTSGKIGVYKMTGYDKWCAQINHDGMREYLGSYDNISDAIEARIAAEIKYFG